MSAATGEWSRGYPIRNGFYLCQMAVGVYGIEERRGDAEDKAWWCHRVIRWAEIIPFEDGTAP